MKKLMFGSIMFGVYLAMASLGYSQSVTTNWAFSFKVPTNNIPVFDHYIAGTNQAYNIYATTNAGDITAWPLQAYWTNWTVLTNSSDGSIWYSNLLVLPPGVWWAAVKGTNQNGESFFSQVAPTGPMATSPTSVVMQKSP